jgi:hypothetical protein
LIAALIVKKVPARDPALSGLLRRDPRRRALLRRDAEDKARFAVVFGQALREIGGSATTFCRRRRIGKPSDASDLGASLLPDARLSVGERDARGAAWPGCAQI